MPRGVRGSAKKGAANGPPPSHPAETFREHRRFLIRSLERNDVDMSALIELNKTLHSTKSQILEICGEGILLDLGTGRLRLNPSNNDDELVIDDDNKQRKAKAKASTVPDLTQVQKDLCVDFLLRMKLRRKLSNRLMRRLTRLAHAMDGKDVSPPGLPKYGDSRLKIEPEAFKAKLMEWKKIEQAKKKIETVMQQEYVTKDSTSDTIQRDSTKTSPTEDATKKNDDGAAENGEKHSEEMEIEDAASRNAPETTTSGDVDPKDHIDSENANKPVTGVLKSVKTVYNNPELIDDFKVLREYECEYEKVWDQSSKSFKYTKADDDVADPKPGGIGAKAAFSKLEDLKTERSRWGTNMLLKLPDQPSVEELGLKNRVFHLEERRKRCLEKKHTEEANAVDEGSPVKKRKIEDDSDGEEKNNVEEKDWDDESNNDGKMDVDEDEKGDEESDSEDDEEPKSEVKDKVEEDITPKRSISFTPTPSFHDQDLLRIRYIHRDLLNSSQVELSRKRLDDASAEYNKAYKSSVSLFEARQRIQHSLTFAIAKGRQELTKAHSDYTMAYTTAKQRWRKERFEYDLKKIRTVLPTKRGYRPLGTQYISQYIQGNMSNIQRTTVGHTLADVVDGCILGLEGKVNAQPFRNFVPPPAPGMNAQTGENMAQRQHRIEMEYRTKYNEIDTELQKNEANRARAWRKAMKATAENNAISNTRGSRITLSNYHNVPLPAIRSSVPQTRPAPIIQQPQPKQRAQQKAQQKAQQRAPKAQASYSTGASSSSTVDMSKYSAEKVKMRKSADGSVAPVSKPKKDKDGLYLRPAGRTRKGMQWDAVNGVWIPMQQPLPTPNR